MMSVSIDQELEDAIDRVGRQTVFAHARALGWDGFYVPKHVWWGIVRNLSLGGAELSASAQDGRHLLANMTTYDQFRANAASRLEGKTPSAAVGRQDD